jgi:hypothetical protein
MPSWIGPAVAISLIVIAASYVVIGFVVLVAAREAAEQSKALGRELAHLRADLAPTLNAVNRLSEKGLDLAVLAEDEVKQVISTTRQIRVDVARGVERAKERLADFEATIEVIQEEIDATVVEVGTALETARAGAGMIGQLRRLIRPRRRGGR